jgi:hypothetical protein
MGILLALARPAYGRAVWGDRQRRKGAMNAGVPGLEFEAGLAVYRVPAGTGLRDGVAAVTAAIDAARKGDAARLLVDLRPIAGIPPPGLGQRYALATDWARAAQGAVSIAFLAPPELIDPGRFGVLVAHGAGLDGDVFEDEAMARAWLGRRPSPHGTAP